MKYLSLLLALCCGASYADGIPLYQPGNPTKIEQAFIDKMTTEPAVKRVASVVSVNLSAVDSNLITITIDGTPYTFTGGKRETGGVGTTTWGGTSPDGAQMSITRDDNARILIMDLYLMNRQDDKYTLRRAGQSYALVQIRPMIMIEDPTPEMIAAHKKPPPLTWSKP